ncbi:hypothetical protein BCR39DRAFT_597012 [Naematelia encephala]|uniref:Uncharacterized protein n=1 Tax=Naematelia encephala TaxID=71784 RepID=A0A1Y2BGQ9_9TREE|nr:hypothetical protein BCR39DRAFT_597012 [Naematelia encephala]
MDPGQSSNPPPGDCSPSTSTNESRMEGPIVLPSFKELITSLPPSSLYSQGPGTCSQMPPSSSPPERSPRDSRKQGSSKSSYSGYSDQEAGWPISQLGVEGTDTSSQQHFHQPTGQTSPSTGLREQQSTFGNISDVMTTASHPGNRKRWTVKTPCTSCFHEPGSSCSGSTIREDRLHPPRQDIQGWRGDSSSRLTTTRLRIMPGAWQILHSHVSCDQQISIVSRPENELSQHKPFLELGFTVLSNAYFPAQVSRPTTGTQTSPADWQSPSLDSKAWTICEVVMLKMHEEIGKIYGTLGPLKAD